MKQLIFILAVATMFMAGTVFTGCQTAAEKEQADQDRLEAAQADLDAAADKLATAEEWRAFKTESEEKINDIEIRIAELKEKMKNSGKILDGLYAQRIETLEQKNRDLRTKMANYEQNQSDWESFKREFNHDMDELGQALKDFTVDNKN
ncbi:MAG: hypothetical protein IPL49_05775 [Saprospirales bacterium]|nr:hypothetical protein [Saprospirales bacterium]